MTRTTLDLDEPILNELKSLQKTEKKSLGQLAAELIAESLSRRRKSSGKPKKFRWISRDLKPRIDLEDKEAVNAILDADLIRKHR
jgi:hypothetical protein